MNTIGTPRYFLNICSWFTGVEKHLNNKDCKEPKYFRPKALNININYNEKFNRFLNKEEDSLKNMKTLFVVDDSGSVFEQGIYFAKVRQLFLYYYNIERGDKFYIWNNDYFEKTYDEIFEFLEEMDGVQGTLSSLIAKIANVERENNFEHLIIITDGDVKEDEVDLSDKLVKEYKINFSFVSTYIIDTTGEKLNESVGCPYSRNCPGSTFIVLKDGSQKEKASLLKEDLEIFEQIENIKTFEEFNSKYYNIFRAIRAKCLGKKSDTQLKEKFLNFKNKIKIPNNKKNEFEIKINELENMINGSLRILPIIAT